MQVVKHTAVQAQLDLQSYLAVAVLEQLLRVQFGFDLQDGSQLMSQRYLSYSVFQQTQVTINHHEFDYLLIDEDFG